jgi:hypothetical protein
MDLSARFHSVSYQGNYYQMVIIDTDTKNVWDYYLTTKDECYIYIKKWLEQEIKPLREWNLSNFEIVLFSDMGKHTQKRCVISVLSMVCLHERLLVTFRNIMRS